MTMLKRASKNSKLVLNVKMISIICIIAYALFGCFGVKKVDSSSKPISHFLWNELLQKYVDNSGCVNYRGFIEDSLELNSYLKLLGENHPNNNWSVNEKKAYWINAYNAYTIQLVIRNYPLKSIKEIGGKIYRINTTWAIKFIDIEDVKYSLDNIEHDILRKKFNDARIHVAVNCASKSCPALYNKAFTSKDIDDQLDSLFEKFLNDTSRNVIDKEEIYLSKIFSWFNKDFKKGGKTLVEFLNNYQKEKIKENVKIKYLDYDWSLNQCK